MTRNVQRGDIVLVRLDGAEEQELRNDEGKPDRPCLVVQNDVGNRFSPLAIVAPLTDARQAVKELPILVLIKAEEAGPRGKASVINCGQLRTIDLKRLKGASVSRASLDVMRKVDHALAISLGLQPSTTSWISN